MRVKVCGITQLEQLQELPGVGAGFAGMIFYPKSPRYVFKNLSISQIKKENTINKIGVFVNSSYEEILTIVDECRLQIVQLHGDETPGFCEKISNYVSVIKAFRVSEDDNIEWMIRPFHDACDMFMFDTMGAGYGGTGKKFNWDLLLPYQIDKPYFLSGGIEPGDEDRLKVFAKQPAASSLFAIDINSRFETSPGIKNLELVRKFIAEIQ